MSLGMIIGGNYYGGYGTTPGYTSPTVVSQTTRTTTDTNPSPATISSTVSSTPPQFSLEPVDMASGAYVFDHVDLALGGSGPKGLAFKRSYSSSRRLDDQGLGYGWHHNYDIRLEEGSNGNPGLGLRSPLDMVPMIAAMYVSIDLLKNVDTLQGSDCRTYR